MSSIVGRLCAMQMSEAIEDFQRWWSVGHATGGVGRMGGYITALNQFALFVRNKNVQDITSDDVLEWYEMMRKLRYATNSFVAKNPALRTFFKFVRSNKQLAVLDPSAVPLPRQEILPRRVKDEAIYEKLLTALEDSTIMGRRDKALTMLLMDCGGRVSEVLSLNVEHMDTVRKAAVISTKKSRGMRPMRELCWTKRTNDALILWLESMHRKPEDPVFISMAGPGIGVRMGSRAAESVLRKYCDKAEIPNIVPHELRHRLGHILARNGVNAHMISNILGHSSIQSSMRYTMMDNKELRDSYHEIMGE